MSLFSSNDEHFCTPFALHNNKDESSRKGQLGTTRLEPENELGNVEYKLRLTDPTPERVERLVTQLKWRIREGHGEAILFLGVRDNGMFVGLTADEIRLSLETLEQMVSKIGAKMSVVNERIVDKETYDEAINLEAQATSAKGKIIRNRVSYGRYREKQRCPTAPSSNEHDVTDENSGANDNSNNISISSSSSRKASNNCISATTATSKQQQQPRGKLFLHPVRKVLQILVKQKTHDISEELRVAVLGPTDSGKSTLLGVLSHGEFDNGRGSARLNLFRHRHEIRSGHTSSISQEIFGLASNGQPQTYSTCLTSKEIIESSSRIVTLIDLAGHQRYLSTTLFGLGSHSPDIVVLVVSAIGSCNSQIMDHISLALGMEKFLVIVINKIDLATGGNQDDCCDEITTALQANPSTDLRRTAVRVTSLNDAICVGRDSSNTRIVPIFFTSCVDGAGLSLLYAFFNEVSPRLNSSNFAVDRPPELQVDETFEVPGIGTVISGLITDGIIREGDEMLLGPDDEGRFSRVSIVSVQRHKIPCNYARAGQKCTMAISAAHSEPSSSSSATRRLNVRRGMVMKDVCEPHERFTVCNEFEASVKFLANKPHRIGCGTQVSVYIGNVKQTCFVRAANPLHSASQARLAEGGGKSSTNTWLLKLRFSRRPEHIREGSRLILRHASTKGVGQVCQVTPLSSSSSSSKRADEEQII